MPSARIRPPVRKSRREAHGGARPFAKPEKASEAFLVPGRIVAGGAQLAEQGFLRRQALRQKSNGHHRARPQRREGLPLPRDRLLRRHADRLDDRDLPGFGLGQRHALQSVPPRPQRGSPRNPFGSRMSLPMARLDWVDGQIRIRPIHVEKGCSPDNSAWEGFFGAIKNEMFYNEGQSRMTVKEFIPYLEKYLIWFRKRRTKESLGYKSMIDRRREIGMS